MLYSFQAHGDGFIPAGGVVFDKQGSLYGATEGGGTPGVGEVFQLTPPTRHGGPWTETIIHSFQNGNDGDTASSGVISDSDGNLYGVAEYNGTGSCSIAGQVVGCGVAYELTPPAGRGSAWTETVVYTFQGGNDGDFPSGNLLLDSRSNLYGTTVNGGAASFGTVFQLTAPANQGSSWKETLLHSFVDTGGSNPEASLTFAATGDLYGVACCGGDSQDCEPNSRWPRAASAQPMADHERLRAPSHPHHHCRTGGEGRLARCRRRPRSGPRRAPRAEPECNTPAVLRLDPDFGTLRGDRPFERLLVADVTKWLGRKARTIIRTEIPVRLRASPAFGGEGANPQGEIP